ncbi:MAG: ribonuclease J [bacterium]|nr:ribonuclease J [bacterium]
MKEGALRFIPLGGVGTFGMNCSVLEFADEMLLIDVGVKFPQGNYPGVDLFLPDLTYVTGNAHRLTGVVLTHGHDDHVGALPYLLNQVDVPVYGTAFTLAMAWERLANGGRGGRNGEGKIGGEMNQVLFGSPFEVGSAVIEAVPVDHSIPDSAALIIRTPAGTVVHSGDFRIPGGRAGPGLEPLRQAGRDGVDLLLCDSTNAERPGVTGSEEDVADSIEAMFRETEGRVFVATFASHIGRMGAVLRAAHRTGRKVVLEGRRMVRNFEIARNLGYLVPPRGVVTADSGLMHADAGRAVYLTTGTQGEPFSALTRIARGEHSQIQVGPGDTVIFSSRMIPGNELAVAQNIDNLFRMGAMVYYQAPPRIHVSGHASAGEILTLLSMTSPRHFVPVHGDYRNLVACAGLARKGGVLPENVHILDPGQVLEVGPETASLGESVLAGRMLVDGTMIATLGDPVIKDRRRIAREGVVVVAVSLPGKGKSIPEPAVHSLGVSVGPQGEEIDLAAAAAARQVLKAWKKEGGSREDLENSLKIAVRGIYRKELEKRPTIIPVILDNGEG